MDKSLISVSSKKENKIYLKKLLPKTFEEEVEKFSVFHTLSLDSPFKTPKVISFDLFSSTISFEYLEDIYSIREYYLSFLRGMSSQEKEECLNIFRKCGESLAYIHCNLLLSKPKKWDPPEKYKKILRKFLTKHEFEELENTPQVFLHSDFGFSNVLLQRQTHALVVIDCAPNFHTTFSIQEKGSIYIDISNFFSCLDGIIRVSIKDYLNINWESRTLLKNAFIEGYQKKSLISLNIDLINKMSKATSMCYFQRRYKYLKALCLYNILYSPFKL